MKHDRFKQQIEFIIVTLSFLRKQESI